MRVFGITYDHTVNYGSCFQAYALQHTIEKLRVGNTTCSYQLIPIKTFVDWKEKKTWKNLIVSPLMKLNRKQFAPFEKRYMHFAPVSSTAELPGLNKEADAFVCGSDVIWNPDFNFGETAFYLDFAEKYKFSYAASFGRAEINEKVLRTVSPLLNRFDCISVRDKTSESIARQCTGKPIRIVGDPVLLLDRKEWDEIAGTAHSKEKNIFVYATHLNDNVKAFLQMLQKDTGLKIVCSAAGPKQALKLKMLRVQKPEDWLRLLRDAEYVVTNSFHATVFSILFQKKFFTVVHGDKAKGINVRMNDFLHYVGLEDRIFSTVPTKLDLNEISYASVNEKVCALREESLAFLQDNLDAAYRRNPENDPKEKN